MRCHSQEVRECVKGKKENIFKRGKETVREEVRACDGENNKVGAYLKAEEEQTYTERCLCSDFWKRSEVIWHTAWSSPASSCTVAARTQTQT